MKFQLFGRRREFHVERVVPVFLELGALVLLSYKGNCHHLTLDISLATDC